MAASSSRIISPSTQLQELIGRKGIHSECFTRRVISLEAPIEEHTAHLYKYIYGIPYQNRPSVEDEKTDAIHRTVHGIQHVSRAAMYLPFFANLYRRYNDQDALRLIDDDIKLLQIAMLFHDSAREDENEDKWDHESGQLLYCYLTETLNVPSSKAKLLAEAVANKDVDEEKSYSYLELQLNEINELTWKRTPPRPKNIYQKLIHDSDCLDIIRARPHFDGTYLDFYKDRGIRDFAKFEEAAQAITEARSIIETEGDSYLRIDLPVKKRYEHEGAYRAHLECLKNPHFLVIPKLYANGKLLTKDQATSMALLPEVLYDKRKPLTTENMSAAVRQGQVFYRGVATPSALRKKVSHSGENREETKETFAQLEIRKMDREPGTKTRTSKLNAREKDGNPNRSVSYIGNGGAVYSDAGFLIVSPDLASVKDVSEIDADTGRHKEKRILDKKYTRKETEDQLLKLIKRQQLGGTSRTRGSRDGFAESHNELAYHVREFHAIGFSQDPKVANYWHNHNPYPYHPSSPVLQAIFLQKTYEKMIGKTPRTSRFPKTLPIFEYSGIHNFCIKREYNDDAIASLWSSMCGDYIQKQIDENHFSVISASLEDIKILSMYGDFKTFLKEHISPADVCYDDEKDAVIKAKINAAIVEKRNHIVALHQEKIYQQLKDEKEESRKPLLLDNSFVYSLIQHDELFQRVEIKVKINTLLDSKKSVLTEIVHENMEQFLSKIETVHINPVNCEIINLLRLAQKIDRKDIVNEIKEQAIKLFTDSIYRKAFESFYINKLFELSKELFIFEELKRHLKTLVMFHLEVLGRYFHDNKEQYKNCLLYNGYKQYEDLIVLLQKHQLMTSEDLNEVAQRMKAIIEVTIREHIDEPSLVLIKFLDLTQILCMDREEVKHIILPIIKEKSFVLSPRKDSCYLPESYSYDLMKQLAEYGFLNDKEFFTAIAESMYSQFGWSCESYFNCLLKLSQARKEQSWQVQLVEEFKLKDARKILDINIGIASAQPPHVFLKRALSCVKNAGISLELQKKLFETILKENPSIVCYLIENPSFLSTLNLNDEIGGVFLKQIVIFKNSLEEKEKEEKSKMPTISILKNQLITREVKAMPSTQCSWEKKVASINSVMFSLFDKKLLHDTGKFISETEYKEIYESDLNKEEEERGEKLIATKPSYVSFFKPALSTLGYKKLLVALGNESLTLEKLGFSTASNIQARFS